jgi:hypothetical protein
MPAKTTQRALRKAAEARHKRLESSLGNLTQADLIRPFIAEEVEYIFKHALVQDSAQSSLLLHDRTRLHLQVAHAFEHIFQERCIDEYAQLLVGHYAAAGDDEKTCTYATIAGDQAFRVYALPEASAFYTQALDAATRLPDTPTRNLIHLYYQRGQAYYSNSQWEEAWANYEAMAREAEKRQDRSLELWSLVERTVFRSVFSPLFEPKDAQTLATRALAIAEKLQDRAARSKVLWGLMRVKATGRDASQAIEYGREAIALAQETGQPEQAAYVLGDLQYAYRVAGQLPNALDALNQARVMWQELGQQHMLADNLNQTADLYALLGEFAAGEQAASQALTLSRQTNNPAQEVLGLLELGGMALEQGRISNALPLLAACTRIPGAWSYGFSEIGIAGAFAELGMYEAAIRLAESSFAVVKRSPLIALLGNPFVARLTRLYLEAGRQAEAERTLQELNPEADARLYVFFFGFDPVPFAQAALELERGEYDRAAQTMQEVVSQIQQFGSIKYLPDAYRLLAQAYMAQKNWMSAAEGLNQARRIAERIGARKGLWKIFGALSEVYAVANDANAAAQHRALARAEIEFIAAQTPEAFVFDSDVPLHLRESFLNLPDVQKILNAQD